MLQLGETFSNKVVYRKSMQHCNCKVPIGCSSKIMERVCHPEKKKIGTLTWTNLKNNLSQLGSIPAINKTTLKPPNTHDDRGTWDPYIFTKHVFENSFKKSLPQSCICFWGLIDSHVSKLTNNRSKLPSASMGRERAPGDCFNGHRLVEVFSQIMGI